MSEDPNTNPEGQQETAQGQHATSQTEASWQEVGRQFQALGASLAQAVRTAWEDEQTQKQLKAMRAGLEAMVHDVGKAVEDTANTPKGQQIREEATRTVEAIGKAGQQTAQEVRPHLISALEQLNDELRKLIDRMEKKETPPTPPEDPQPPQA